MSSFNNISWNHVDTIHNFFYMPDLSGRIIEWRGRLSVRLSTKLVNTIQTEPFQLGPSNLVHILLWKEDEPYWFSRSGVKGQGHPLHIVVKLCKRDTDWTVPAMTSNLVRILLMTRGWHLLILKVMGQGHTQHIVVKPCKRDTDWTVPVMTVKLRTHTTYDKRMTHIDYKGQGSNVKVTCYTLLFNLVNTIQTEPF